MGATGIGFAVFAGRPAPLGAKFYATGPALDRSWALDGPSVMVEPWAARRKRFEDLLVAPPPGVCLVPVTDDAPALWDTWVGLAGESIALRERTSLYHPGVRSPAWLKLKPKLSLDVVVTGGSAERVR